MLLFGKEMEIKQMFQKMQLLTLVKVRGNVILAMRRLILSAVKES